MKKILVILVLLSFQAVAFGASYIDKQLKEVKKNSKYNTSQKYERSFDKLDTYIKKSSLPLKDPKLFTFSTVTPVDANKYKAKLQQDEKIYKSVIEPAINKKLNSINIDPAAVDFYRVYRIAERLIRANNLEYTNWRFAIRKSHDEINAASGANNFVEINTALYDSLYNNEDALAFVMAHELSHLLLGHSQRSAEINKKLNDIVNAQKVVNDNSAAYNLANSTASMVYIKKYYNELKMMEFMADAEACTLLIKAGYSPSKAMEALNFLDVAPQIKYFIATHPLAKERLESANQNIYYANPNWVEEGKLNIYNSPVLTCKKSSDRVSIVINKVENFNKVYEPENIVQRLSRIAYASYIKGNMNDASKYFKKLADATDDYRAYLYLSYAEEQLFMQTNAKKHEKLALKSILKAKELNPNEPNVQKQFKDLSL